MIFFTSVSDFCNRGTYKQTYKPLNKPSTFNIIPNLTIRAIQIKQHNLVTTLFTCDT